MISKKRLRQRIADFARGAGCPWIEEDGYFDNLCPKTLQRFMMATRDGLGFDTDCVFTNVCWLDMWDDIERITDTLYDHLSEDLA